MRSIQDHCYFYMVAEPGYELIGVRCTPCLQPCSRGCVSFAFSLWSLFHTMASAAVPIIEPDAPDDGTPTAMPVYEVLDERLAAMDIDIIGLKQAIIDMQENFSKNQNIQMNMLKDSQKQMEEEKKTWKEQVQNKFEEEKIEKKKMEHMMKSAKEFQEILKSAEDLAKQNKIEMEVMRAE